MQKTMIALLLALILLYGCAQGKSTVGTEQNEKTANQPEINGQTVGNGGETTQGTSQPGQSGDESTFQELDQFNSADTEIEDISQNQTDFEFNESQLG